MCDSECFMNLSEEEMFMYMVTQFTQRDNFSLVRLKQQDYAPEDLPDQGSNP